MGECSRSYEAGYADGYNQGARVALGEVAEGLMDGPEDWKDTKKPRIHTAPSVRAADKRIAQRMADRVPPSAPKRKPTAANKKYSKNFAKVKGRFQTTKGKWKKGGFGKAVRAAHKLGKASK